MTNGLRASLESRSCWRQHSGEGVELALVEEAEVDDFFGRGGPGDVGRGGVGDGRRVEEGAGRWIADAGDGEHKEVAVCASVGELVDRCVVGAVAVEVETNSV